MKIMLDPGHGKNSNPGVIAGYYEGTQMFKLAGFLKAELEKRGFTVGITRKSVTDDPSLGTRGKMAKGYDLLLSLHSNAPGEEAKKAGTYNKIRGVVVLDSVTKPCKELADALGVAVAKVMGNNFRGTVYRRGNNGDYYGVIRNAVTVCPRAMIIEHGFHTNPDDCKFLMDDNNLKKIASAEADVLVKYFKGGIDMSNKTVVLKKGSKGEAVKKLQQDLIKLGYGKYLEPYGADGDFGGLTEKAVMQFQKDHNLKVDGIVGPETFGKIEALLNEKKKAVPAATSEVIYRVRKSWEDAKSQIGAFKNLQNALALAKAHPGYCVFDEKGNKIVENNNEDLLRRIAELEAKLEAIKEIILK